MDTAEAAVTEATAKLASLEAANPKDDAAIEAAKKDLNEKKAALKKLKAAATKAAKKVIPGCPQDLADELSKLKVGDTYKSPSFQQYKAITTAVAAKRKVDEKTIRPELDACLDVLKLEKPYSDECEKIQLLLNALPEANRSAPTLEQYNAIILNPKLKLDKTRINVCLAKMNIPIPTGVTGPTPTPTPTSPTSTKPPTDEELTELLKGKTLLKIGSEYIKLHKPTETFQSKTFGNLYIGSMWKELKLQYGVEPTNMNLLKDLVSVFGVSNTLTGKAPIEVEPTCKPSNPGLVITALKKRIETIGTQISSVNITNTIKGSTLKHQKELLEELVKKIDLIKGNVNIPVCKTQVKTVVKMPIIGTSADYKGDLDLIKQLVLLSLILSGKDDRADIEARINSIPVEELLGLFDINKDGPETKTKLSQLIEKLGGVSDKAKECEDNKQKMQTALELIGPLRDAINGGLPTAELFNKLKELFNPGSPNAVDKLVVPVPTGSTNVDLTPIVAAIAELKTLIEKPTDLSAILAKLNEMSGTDPNGNASLNELRQLIQAHAASSGPASLDEIKGKLDALTGSVNKNDLAALTALVQQVIDKPDLGAKVDALITALPKTDLGPISAEIAALKTSIGALNTSIGDFPDPVDNLKLRLIRIEELLKTPKVEPTDFTGLQTKINELGKIIKDDSPDATITDIGGALIAIDALKMLLENENTKIKDKVSSINDELYGLINKDEYKDVVGSDLPAKGDTDETVALLKTYIEKLAEAKDKAMEMWTSIAAQLLKAQNELAACQAAHGDLKGKGAISDENKAKLASLGIEGIEGIEDLNDIIKRLSEEIERLKKELEECNTDKAAKLAVKDEEITQLKAQIAACNAAHGDLEKKGAISDENKAKLAELGINSIESLDNNTLQQIIDALKAKITELEGNLTAKAAELATANQVIERLKAQLATALAAKAECDKAVEAAKAECEKVKSDTADASQQAIAAVSTAAQAKIDAAQAAKTECDQKLKAALEDVTRLEAELAAALAKVTELEAELAKCKEGRAADKVAAAAELAKCQADAEAASQAAQAAEAAYKKACEEAAAEAKRKKTEELAAKDAEIAGLQAELEALKKGTSASSKTDAEQKAKIAELTASLAACEKAKGECVQGRADDAKEHEGNLKDLLEGLKTSQAALAAAEAKVAACEEEKKGLSAQIAELKLRLTVLERSNVDLKNQLVELKNRFKIIIDSLSLDDDLHKKVGAYFDNGSDEDVITAGLKAHLPKDMCQFLNYLYVAIDELYHESGPVLSTVSSKPDNQLFKSEDGKDINWITNLSMFLKKLFDTMNVFDGTDKIIAEQNDLKSQGGSFILDYLFRDIDITKVKEYDNNAVFPQLNGYNIIKGALIPSTASNKYLLTKGKPTNPNYIPLSLIFAIFVEGVHGKIKTALDSDPRFKKCIGELKTGSYKPDFKFVKPVIEAVAGKYPPPEETKVEVVDESEDDKAFKKQQKELKLADNLMSPFCNSIDYLSSVPTPKPVLYDGKSAYPYGGNGYGLQGLGNDFLDYLKGYLTSKVNYDQYINYTEGKRKDRFPGAYVEIFRKMYPFVIKRIPEDFIDNLVFEKIDPKVKNPLINNTREDKLKTIIKDILQYNINCRNKKSNVKITDITSEFLTYADKLYKHLTDKKSPKPEPTENMIYGITLKEPEKITAKLPKFSVPDFSVTEDEEEATAAPAAPIESTTFKKPPSFSSFRARSNAQAADAADAAKRASHVETVLNPLTQPRGLTRSSSSKLGSPPRAFGLKTSSELAGTLTTRPGLAKRRKTRRNNKRT